MKRHDVDNAAPVKKKVAETRYGKDIVIRRRGYAFVIEVEGGATQPPIFEGQFDWTTANHVVKAYLEDRGGRVVESEYPEVELK